MHVRGDKHTTRPAAYHDVTSLRNHFGFERHKPPRSHLYVRAGVDLIHSDRPDRCFQFHAPRDRTNDLVDRVETQIPIDARDRDVPRVGPQHVREDDVLAGGDDDIGVRDDVLIPGRPDGDCRRSVETYDRHRG